MQLLAPRGTPTVLSAAGGNGKTTIAVAMAVSYATRQEILGLKVYNDVDNGAGGNVAYMLLEDEEADLIRSVVACIKHHRITARALDGLHIYGHRRGEQMADLVGTPRRHSVRHAQMRLLLSTAGATSE
jgi:RecA-family ATPase